MIWYWPPWGLTEPWRLYVGRGGDEYGRRTLIFHFGPLGAVLLADPRQARRGDMLEALRQIRDEQGAVCANFELCTHSACKSSHAAWTLADAALRGWELP